MTFSPSANTSLPARNGNAILPLAIYDTVMSEIGVNSHYVPGDKSHLSAAASRHPDIQLPAGSRPPSLCSSEMPSGFSISESVGHQRRTGSRGPGQWQGTRHVARSHRCHCCGLALVPSAPALVMQRCARCSCTALDCEAGLCDTKPALQGPTRGWGSRGSTSCVSGLRPDRLRSEGGEGKAPCRGAPTALSLLHPPSWHSGAVPVGASVARHLPPIMSRVGPSSILPGDSFLCRDLLGHPGAEAQLLPHPLVWVRDV